MGSKVAQGSFHDGDFECLHYRIAPIAYLVIGKKVGLGNII